MGNSIEKKVSSLKKKLTSSEGTAQREQSIGIEFECPSCELVFGPKSLQTEVAGSPLRCTLTCRPASARSSRKSSRKRKKRKRAR